MRIPSSDPYPEPYQSRPNLPLIRILSLINPDQTFLWSVSWTWSIQKIPSSDPYPETDQSKPNLPLIRILNLINPDQTFLWSVFWTWSIQEIPSSDPYPEPYQSRPNLPLIRILKLINQDHTFPIYLSEPHLNMIRPPILVRPSGIFHSFYSTNICIRHLPICATLSAHCTLLPYLKPEFTLQTNKQTPWPLVRVRTIPTERPPLVDEI
jgi:hypothetical protein